MSHVTRLLQQIQAGDLSSAQQLFPLVYDELRRLAAARLREEKPGQTLQATALVHEAFLRLVDVKNVQSWDSRGHFFSAAAESIRRILIDQARRKQSHKRGGDWKRQDLEEITPIAMPDNAPAEDLLALDEALQQLEATYPDKAQLVKLRYFAGLTLEDTAASLGISVATAKRHWAFARSWLYGKLHAE